MGLRLKLLAALPLCFFAGWLAIQALETTWLLCGVRCPNVDVLSWDGNLRMIDTLDQYQEFRAGHWLAGLRPYFDAPTWPPLRAAIMQAVYQLHGSGPDASLDVAVSFVFYLLLFPSLLLIAPELTRDWLRGALAFFFATSLVIHSRQFPMFSVSGMLETQGMFFYLWSAYFLYKAYEWQSLREEDKRALQIRRRFLFGLFFFSQGLYHTKYPYGIMLALAFFAYDALRNPGQYIDLATLAWTQRYRGWRRWLLAFVFASLVLFALGKAAPGLNSKSFKYIFYAATLLLLIDFHAYLWRFRARFLALFDSASRQIYSVMVLPMLIWTYLQPDRLSSVLGTQQRSQEETRSYIVSLSADVFDSPLPLAAVALTTLIGLFGVLAYILRSGQGTEDDRRARLYRAFSRPIVAALLITLFQVFILEFLTGNKQLRHVYHLIPAGLLLWCAWSLRYGGGSGAPQGLAGKTLHYALLALTLLAPLAAIQPALAPGGILDRRALATPTAVAPAPRYAEGRPLCFTGDDRELYEPVRWFQRRIDPRGKYILFNTFHDLTAPAELAGLASVERERLLERMFHGRVRATDFDLLLRMQTLFEGRVRNDSPRFADWRAFDAALLLSTDCDDARGLAQLHERAVQTGSRYVETRRLVHPGGDYCLTEFRLIR